MSTIARLYKDAELDIAGELNERLPKVTNGLLFNLPMDGSLLAETVGRNLYKGTLDFNSTYWNLQGTASLVDSSIFPRHKAMKIVADGYADCVVSYTTQQGFDFSDTTKTWTISVDIAGNTTGQKVGITVSVDRQNWQQQTLNSDGSYKHLSWTFMGNGSPLQGFRFETTGAISSHPIYIVNLKIEESNIATPWTPAPEDVRDELVTTNCNLTNQGIYVEEGTTNLIDDDLKNAITSTTGTKGILQSDGFYKFDLPSSNTEIYQNRFRPVKTSTTYTESFLFKTDSTNVTNGKFSISFYTSIHHIIPVIIQKLGYNLYKASASYTTGAEISFRAIDIMGWNNLNGTYFSIRDAQLEEKPYATSFIQGTRNNSNNGVQIPTSYFQFPFSVTMEVIPDIKDGSNSVYGQEPTLMYIAGLWKTKSGGGYYGEINQVQRKNILNKFRYTLVFRQTNFDVYINSNKSTLNYNYNSFNLSDIPMFTVGCRGYEPGYGYANALYKNIAFYTRELTQSDVDKLCNNKFSINKDGIINGQTLIEKQNLLTGTKNFTGWTSNNSNNILDSSMIFNGLIPSKVIGRWAYYYQNFNFEQNKTYTLSAWVRTNIDNKINVGLFSFASYGQGHYIIPKANKWYKWSYSFTIDGVDRHTSGTKLVRVETGDATSTNPLWVCGIKLMEGNTNKMSITKDEIHVNELSEGGV